MSATNPVLTVIQVMGASGANALPLTGLAGSAFCTATFQLTANWELRVPIQAVQAANVSAGPELAIFAAAGDGNSAPKYETIPLINYALTRSASANDVATIRLDAGLYCARLCSGGPNTATVGLLTGLLVTGIANV